eukprot:gene12864-7287_t
MNNLNQLEVLKDSQEEEDESEDFKPENTQEQQDDFESESDSEKEEIIPRRSSRTTKKKKPQIEVAEEEQEEFEVEAILHKRKFENDPRWFYLVKWSHYSMNQHNTWEPVNNIKIGSQNLLLEFESSTSCISQEILDEINSFDQKIIPDFTHKKIKKVHQYKNKKEYLMEWEGVSKETWEPALHIPKDILYEFTKTSDVSKQVPISYHFFEDLFTNKPDTTTILVIINSKFVTFDFFENKTKYLLKPMDASWIHVFWVDEDIIESIPEKARFLSFFKAHHPKPEFKELMLTENCQIERIINESTSQYLVKWKSLDYEEAS